MDSIFLPGKITVLLDASAGSSGKGALESFVTKSQVGNFQFVCNTFSPQASHWVMDRENDFSACYKQFNSCAHRHEEFEKMYIGQGGSINLKAFFEELEMTGIPPEKIGISPLTPIVQDIDRLYEEGKVEFSGRKNDKDLDGTIKTGSTCSGVGATRARRILRDKKILLARDVKELREFICDVPGEIMARARAGQSGLLVLAQGFQLSNGLPQFYPNVTSRNITVAAGFDDMMLPVRLVGNVLINLRTYPIRINSKKYIEKGTGKHLTWDEVKSNKFKYEVIESFSGEGYKDQIELDWETVESSAGTKIPEKIKLTSLTKLPRRVFTFSRKNLHDAILHNQVPGRIFLSLRFCDWVDGRILESDGEITPKLKVWIDTNIAPIVNKFDNVKLKYLGLSQYTEDVITIE